jgi:hypothetical protein
MVFYFSVNYIQGTPLSEKDFLNFFEKTYFENLKVVAFLLTFFWVYIKSITFFKKGGLRFYDFISAKITLENRWILSKYSFALEAVFLILFLLTSLHQQYESYSFIFMIGVMFTLIFYDNLFNNYDIAIYYLGIFKIEYSNKESLNHALRRINRILGFPFNKRDLFVLSQDIVFSLDLVRQSQDEIKQDLEKLEMEIKNKNNSGMSEAIINMRKACDKQLTDHKRLGYETKFPIRSKVSYSIKSAFKITFESLLKFVIPISFLIILYLVLKLMGVDIGNVMELYKQMFP